MFGPLRNYFRRAGHGHRDAKQWARAADAYGWHVRLHPHDLGDWVRLAEMSLAAGRPEAAERAYARALREAPRDAHIAFQLAQSLKRIGQDAEALAMFKLSLQLTERTRAKPTATTPILGEVPPDGLVLYSVQDLIGYLITHPTVTGIQRVQLGILRHVMATQGDRAGFVMTDAQPGLERGDFWLIDREALIQVMREAEAAHIDHDCLKARIAECRRAARAIRPGAGHTLVLLGAFWALGNEPTRYFAAKLRGARIGAYLYDLIPISHPQFCEMDLSLYFSVGFGQMVAIADFILTISEDTARQVRALLAQHDRSPVPVQAVPLAHGMTDLPDSRAARSASNSGPFVAYVSTIEARKNHIYLVRVWQALMKRGVAVPDLVFVGRLGWKIAPLMALLEETHFLGGRVRIRHGLRDAELGAVYRDAEFTVFTSFVEGWGLPIGESLAQGTPCVASRTSSMPEVGGDLVDYVDPFDVDDGVAVISGLLADPKALQARRRRLAESFVPRTWGDVGRDFVRAVDDAVTLPVRPMVPPQLMAGREVRPGAFDDDFSLETVMGTPRALLLADGFAAPDDRGCAMACSKARIRFRSDLPPETAATLTLDLRRSSEAGDGSITVVAGMARANRTLASLPCIDDLAAPIILDAVVEADGTIAVHFDVQNGEGPDCVRPILVSFVHRRTS